MDVVLQYKVHRDAVDPPLLSGEDINVDQSKLGCPPTPNNPYWPPCILLGYILPAFRLKPATYH